MPKPGTQKFCHTPGMVVTFSRRLPTGKVPTMAYRRRSPEEKLAALKAKEAQLKAAIAKEEAQAKDRERKQDTRRKIVAGALALEHMAINEEWGAEFRRVLHRYVKRADDRALLGLEPLDDEAAGNREEEEAPSLSEPFHKQAVAG
jgi:large subunit ribosomal protein L7/L12